MAKGAMSDGLNLAICSVGELFGGVERHLLGLMTYLRRRGETPCFVLFSDSELASRARALGIKPIIVKGRHPWDVSVVWRLARVFAEAGVNLVHVHGYRATVLCALARRLYSYRMVKTEHGDMHLAQTGVISKAKFHCYRRLDTWATRSSVSDVCYVTHDLRSRCEDEHVGLARHTIYNGIDELRSETTQRPPEYQHGHFNLAMVGRLDPVKGIHHAIRAMSDPAIPSNVRLFVIGDGPMANEIERLIADLQLDDCVRLLGFRSNVFDYLAHCDALLLSSLHEGLPYALLEAMSLGKPILASRVGGLGEILQEGQTALLFDPGDVRGMVDAVIRISEDSSIRESMGEHVKLQQRRCYSLERMGNHYWKVYWRALQGASSACMGVADNLRN